MKLCDFRGLLLPLAPTLHSLSPHVFTCLKLYSNLHLEFTSAHFRRGLEMSPFPTQPCSGQSFLPSSMTVILGALAP